MSRGATFLTLEEHRARNARRRDSLIRAITSEQ